MVLSASSSGGWHSDSALFIYSTYDFSWFSRGGDYTLGSHAGEFYFDALNGYRSNYGTSRAILVSLK